MSISSEVCKPGQHKIHVYLIKIQLRLVMIGVGQGLPNFGLHGATKILSSVCCHLVKLK